MFTPPRCPYRHCPFHAGPVPGFYHQHGSYHPKCRPRPVPRFRCLACRRTFSRQTFRADYRDHRPHLNQRLLELLTSGVGLRQSSRLLLLSLRCTELKFRKIARHLRRLDLNLRTEFTETAALQLDEFESYEGERNTRPLSVPTLIEAGSRYIVWSESATIRPRGSMSKRRKRRIAAAKERYGPRKDRSRRALQRTLRRGSELVRNLPQVRLQTDEKSSYGPLAKAAFGSKRLRHEQTNSRIARRTWNPLFPINHMEALVRDLLGRLRRNSWLVSKKRRYLDLGLAMHAAYRNLVRPRFNRDQESPAQLLGFIRRRLTRGEAISWRQDWGRDSIHPLSRTCATVDAVARKALRVV